MIKITKLPPPPLLKQYSCDPDADWDGPDTRNGLKFTEVKAELRNVLVREQHGLCAYCMRRIYASQAGMRIEHVIPRSVCQDERSRHLRLNYSNLLGCCSGKIGDDTCCDVRKGDQIISSHLAVAAPDFVEECIRYAKDGMIRIDDEDLQDQVDKYLNLNASLSKANRRRIYEGFCSFLRKAGQTARHKLERKLDEEGDHHLLEWPEYWGCRRYFMIRKLRNLS